MPENAFRFSDMLFRKIGEVGEVSLVAIGDIDGDRLDDVVVATRFVGTAGVGVSNTIIIFRASPSGGWLPEVHLPLGRFDGAGNDIALGDVDGDGRRDVVVSNENRINIVRYKPTQGYLRTAIHHDPGCKQITLIDINLDGRSDIACFGYGTLSYFYSDGGGGAARVTTTTLPVIPGWWDLTATDINADGFNDLVLLRDYDTSELLIHPHNRLDGFGTPWIVELPDNPDGPPSGSDISSWGMAAGDLDNDGRTDLIISTSQRTHTATILYQQADGTFRQEELDTWYVPGAFLIADFDGDGDDDLVIRFTAAPIWHAEYFEQNAGSLKAGVKFASIPGMPHYSNTTSALGDINGDGCLDIAGVDGIYLSYHFGLDCRKPNRVTGGASPPRRR